MILLDRQGGHAGVNFSERMQSASGLLLMRRGDQLEAGLMIRVTSPERGNQDGCIEEFLHPANSCKR
jgi:hypothetical protein